MYEMKIQGRLAILISLLLSLVASSVEAQGMPGLPVLRPIASMDGTISALAAIDDTRVLVGMGHRIVLVDFRLPDNEKIVVASPSLGTRVRHLLLGPEGWAYALTDAAELLALDLRHPEAGLSITSREVVEGVYVGDYRRGGELSWSGGSTLNLLDDAPGLQFFDISRPDLPLRRARFALRDPVGERPLPGALASTDSRVYATTWHPKPSGDGFRTLLSVFDLSDPDRPQPLAEHWLGERESLPDRPWLGAHGDLLIERSSGGLFFRVTPRMPRL